MTWSNNFKWAVINLFQAPQRFTEGSQAKNKSLVFYSQNKVNSAMRSGSWRSLQGRAAVERLWEQLIQANSTAQPRTYSAFSTHTTRFQVISASPLHTSPASCYLFLRWLLCCQPLATSCCPSTTFIVEYKTPHLQRPSWDRKPSGITQYKSQDTTLAVEILLVHIPATTVLPGCQSTTKHSYEWMSETLLPFTFSWGFPGQPSPLSSSLHGCCKLPDRCLAAWSISGS